MKPINRLWWFIRYVLFGRPEQCLRCGTTNFRAGMHVGDKGLTCLKCCGPDAKEGGSDE